MHKRSERGMRVDRGREDGEEIERRWRAEKRWDEGGRRQTRQPQRIWEAE
jgi:hypothetical protein